MHLIRKTAGLELGPLGPCPRILGYSPPAFLPRKKTGEASTDSQGDSADLPGCPGLSFYLAKPQFLHLHHRDKNTLPTIIGGLNERTKCQSRKLSLGHSRGWQCPVSPIIGKKALDRNLQGWPLKIPPLPPSPPPGSPPWFSQLVVMASASDFLACFEKLEPRRAGAI